MDNLDVEIRSIWQPWLRWRCNFAVRYIVPDRVNIMRIMQHHGLLNVQVGPEDMPHILLT
jgi:hypothetical protein